MFPADLRDDGRPVTIRRVVGEWTLVVLATPVLAFPSTFPRVTVGVLTLIVIGMVVVAASDRRALSLGTIAGSLRLPWTLLASTMLVGAIVSPFPELTLPKLSGLVLGMLFLRAVLLTATTAARVWSVAWIYMLTGFGTVVAGLLVSPDAGRYASYVKYEALWSISSAIPRLVGGLPGAEQGVNPNALGGTTLFFLPVLGALAWHYLGAAKSAEAYDGGGRRAARLKGVGCTIAVLVIGVILILSESRAAWVAVAVAGPLAVAAQSRSRALYLLGGGAVTLGLLGWMWWSPANTLRALGFGRLTAWSIAIEAIREHPISGVGLGAFRGLAPALQVNVPEPILPLPHAHNVFLQAALDVGLPGLAAYLALLGAATYMTWQVLRHDEDREERALCLGLWAGLVAIHVFGLVDAIALGAKVGIFLWWNLGVIAALHHVAAARWKRRL